MLRPPEAKVTCSFCEKFDHETGKVWEGFTHKNTYIFRVFLAARAFGVLPRPGGSDQQDPFLLDVLVVLNEMFDRKESLDAREFYVKMSARMVGVV
ncbi:MAG: hypothetical protein FVQ80_11485 [Planctomycetes bacterium]|nr:hypothetical protein [Planctomycetota bacterium]